MRRGWPVVLLGAGALALSLLAPPGIEPGPEPSVVGRVVTLPAAPGASGPPPPEPPAPPARRRRAVTVLVSGDVLVHTGVWWSAQRDAAARGRDLPDFGPMFAGVRRAVSAADLAVCHLETPLAPPTGPYLNYPLFSAPPQVVDGLLAAGYDACTTASNHAVDMGEDGLVRTLEVLDDRGLPHTGTFAPGFRGRRPAVLRAQGVRVGLISATYGTNGMPVEHASTVQLLDVVEVLRQARALKVAGVDVVMVAVHAGSEYTAMPSAQQVAAFAALTASPAVDFVYGHHSHVVQPFTRVHGRWGVYGLGNFVARQPPEWPATYRGMLAEVTFAERRRGGFDVVRPGYRPTLITAPTDPGGVRVVDAVTALADPATPAWLRPRLRAAVVAVRADVGRRGVRLLGPAPR